jgi:peptidoglycan/xylan/chitin deacetylase (PgdA/CDA1 family)
MIRNFPRLLSKQTGRLVSIKSLIKFPTPVFLPFYHVVSNEDLPHILNYNYRNIEQFEKELDFYLQHFNPVSLEDLLSPDPSSKKPFHITFDDGLKECAEIIAPILLKKGIPATFFINPAFIDNESLFHKYKASLIVREMHKTKNLPVKMLLEKHNLSGKKILHASIHQSEIIDEAAEMLGIDFQDFLKKQQPYLTTSQLKSLQQEGFTIGAHSYHHPEFWQISEKQQKIEITSSMNWVSKHLDPKVKAFAFPFTDSGIAKTVLESIQKEKVCNITFGTAGIKYDELKFHFQRYPVENSADFVDDLKSELVYFQLRKIIGQETVTH